MPEWRLWGCLFTGLAAQMCLKPDPGVGRSWGRTWGRGRVGGFEGKGATQRWARVDVGRTGRVTWSSWMSCGMASRF